MTTEQATKLEELEAEDGELDNLLTGLTERLAATRQKLREQVTTSSEDLKNAPDPRSLRIPKTG